MILELSKAKKSNNVDTPLASSMSATTIHNPIAEAVKVCSKYLIFAKHIILQTSMNSVDRQELR